MKNLKELFEETPSIARQCLSVDEIPSHFMGAYEFNRPNSSGSFLVNCQKFYYPINTIDELSAIKYFNQLEDSLFINMVYMACCKDHFINIESVNRETGPVSLWDMVSIGMGFIEEHELVCAKILMNQYTYDKLTISNDFEREENWQLKVENMKDAMQQCHVWTADIHVCELIPNNDIILLSPGEYLGVVAVKEEIGVEPAIKAVSLEEGMAIFNGDYAICIVNIANYKDQKPMDMNWSEKKYLINLCKDVCKGLENTDEEVDFSEASTSLLKLKHHFMLNKISNLDGIRIYDNSRTEKIEELRKLVEEVNNENR